MRSLFVAERISVTRREELPTQPPVSFEWRGRTYRVAKLEAMWHDAGFGPLAYSKRWWQRRHRTYYQVTTESGELFELYLERPQREWFLYRQLFPEEE